jgi:hypothetical protein
LSRGLGDVYKRQLLQVLVEKFEMKALRAAAPNPRQV